MTYFVVVAKPGGGEAGNNIENRKNSTEPDILYIPFGRA